jgi:hypothetical protein
LQFPQKIGAILVVGKFSLPIQKKVVIEGRGQANSLSFDGFAENENLVTPRSRGMRNVMRIQYLEPQRLFWYRRRRPPSYHFFLAKKSPLRSSFAFVSLFFEHRTALK